MDDIVDKLFNLSKEKITKILEKSFERQEFKKNRTIKQRRLFNLNF